MTHFVYRCLGEDDLPVYIGSSGNVYGRLDFHRANAWWANLVTKVTCRSYPDKLTALRVEREAIRDENPLANRVGRWSQNATWSADDFRSYYRARTTGTYVTEWTRTHLGRVRAICLARHGVDLAAREVA